MKSKITITTIAEAISEFKAIRVSDDQNSFNEYINEVFPEIRNYISRQLNLAILRNDLPEGKFKVGDIIDELYIHAYNHIHKINPEESFKNWLYMEADRILNDTITDQEFDDFFFKNIDNFSEDEWAEMEEKYSVDGGGDFVMEEDLDDISYRKNDYELKDIFIEDTEQSLVDKLDKQINTNRLHKHIDMLMPKLPSKLAEIFEMHTQQNVAVNDIAYIKKMSVEEVKRSLKKAKEMLKQSLKTRFQL